MTLPPRRVSVLYEALHRHDYETFGGGGGGGAIGGGGAGTGLGTSGRVDDEVDADGDGGSSINDENNILDLTSFSMRRASRDLLSATNMRSRQLFVDLQYRPPSSIFMDDSNVEMSTSDDGDDNDDDGGDEGDGEEDDDDYYHDRVDDSSLTDTDNEAINLHNNPYMESPDMKSGDRPVSENIPLLPLPEEAPLSTPTPSSKVLRSDDSLVLLSTIIQQISSIAVVGLLSIMISIPFGASYFPIGWRPEESGNTETDASSVVDGDINGIFPIPGKQALGIRMFLFATLMGQLAFTFSSKFENPVGLQMVENVPFLHALCHIVIQEQGYGIEALSTVCFLFGLSSVLVGATFYFLGKWKLGRIVYFFPNHVLVGCIGGIGVFLIITALEVTSDSTFTFDLEGIQTLFSHWELISVVFGFESVLRGLQYVTKDRYGNARFPLLSPVYYCMITPLFYLGLYIFGISVHNASDRGFFFPPVVVDETTSSTTSVWNDPHLWDMFKMVNVTTLSWTAIFKSTGTMIALTAFSLIHVPINIPAFAISTDVGKWKRFVFRSIRMIDSLIRIPFSQAHHDGFDTPPDQNRYRHESGAYRSWICQYLLRSLWWTSDVYDLFEFCLVCQIGWQGKDFVSYHRRRYDDLVCHWTFDRQFPSKMYGRNITSPYWY